ncbi:MAG TPA: DUF1802 family protein [Nitrososphaera sp.]|nr:DUF1802 family protein [Nitrososphaera sp.]
MHALKEWAVVCHALEKGRQVVLLRKGGILEYRQGFEIKHDKFLMFPTFEHQSKDHLQPDYAGMLDKVTSSAPDAGKILLSSFAEPVLVKELTDRAVLKKLEKFHIWNESYVNARMDYNPSKPMSVILLRVFHLSNVIEVQNQDAWAGCRSWVPLDLSVGDATPVLGDSQFDAISREFKEVLSVAA